MQTDTVAERDGVQAEANRCTGTGLQGVSCDRIVIVCSIFYDCSFSI